MAALLTGPLPKILSSIPNPDMKVVLTAAQEIAEANRGKSFSLARQILTLADIAASDPDCLPESLFLQGEIINGSENDSSVAAQGNTTYFSGLERLASYDLAAAIILANDHTSFSPNTFADRKHACFLDFADRATAAKNPPEAIDKPLTNAVLERVFSSRDRKKHGELNIPAYREMLRSKWRAYADHIATVDPVRPLQLACHVLYGQADFHRKPMQLAAAAVWDAYFEPAAEADVKRTLAISLRAIKRHFGLFIPVRLVSGILAHADALAVVDRKEARDTALAAALFVERDHEMRRFHGSALSTDASDGDLHQFREPIAAKWHQLALLARQEDPVDSFINTTAILRSSVDLLKSPLKRHARRVWPELAGCAAEVDPADTYERLFSIHHAGYPHDLWEKAGEVACEVAATISSEEAEKIRQKVEKRHKSEYVM
jgi:hypothetical protein